MHLKQYNIYSVKAGINKNKSALLNVANPIIPKNVSNICFTIEKIIINLL